MRPLETEKVRALFILGAVEAIIQMGEKPDPEVLGVAFDKWQAERALDAYDEGWDTGWDAVAARAND